MTLYYKTCLAKKGLYNFELTDIILRLQALEAYRLVVRLHWST